MFNGAPGRPTVVLYAGSLNAWDGSSNFNFNKELMRRYSGEAAHNVFATPSISPAAAAAADAAVPFARYLAKLPLNLARSAGGALWSFLRAQRWAVVEVSNRRTARRPTIRSRRW